MRATSLSHDTPLTIYRGYWALSFWYDAVNRTGEEGGRAGENPLQAIHWRKESRPAQFMTATTENTPHLDLFDWN
jgi:hypothetical protein